MTMDYSPWVEREILAVFEGSSISETIEVTPIKIGVYAFDINPYLHKFFGPDQLNFLKEAVHGLILIN